MADLIRLEAFGKALGTLGEVLAMPVNPVVRDAAIQRFEYCFELCWKVGKDYLVDQGLEAASPRGVFRDLRNLGLLDEGQLEDCFLMIRDRNLASHTYNETFAEALFGRLAGHLTAMTLVHARLAVVAEER